MPILKCVRSNPIVRTVRPIRLYWAKVCSIRIRVFLTFGVQFSIVAIALMTSIGVAGVPSASLVAIAIIITSIGLPFEAIGVLMVFDRSLDMARTSVNVWGDASCATIIARLEGEEMNVAVVPAR